MTEPVPNTVTCRSTPEEKIALFRSLFRGRDEVFPRRFESADLTTYRRDRRKDVLLQENGCLVLRFLAEDVCERLNDVLDSILRVVSHPRARHPRGQS